MIIVVHLKPILMVIPVTFKPIEVTLLGANWHPTKPFEVHLF